ncbi:MAG TPA: hypothetical protein VNZ86_11165, partial [Bacteroidia bacterium]|nr:hypothetical protein [Bacteroidia bacterium]
CDISHGPDRGTIYINWSDQRNGSGDADVWLVKSTDGGNAWSAPLRVNDDAPGTQQFMSWMTVDQITGKLYVLFYDRRNFDVQDLHTDVYLAVSGDGGESFFNFKVNTNSFAPTESVFFGDYINISAVNDVVRPIWMSCDKHALSVWTALIDASTLNLALELREPHLPLVVESDKQEPVQSGANINFALNRQERVSLELFDRFGKPVRSVYEQKVLKKGSYQLNYKNWAEGIPSGIYLYLLETEEGKQRGKCVIY